MGQYYTAAIKREKGKCWKGFSTWDFKQGLKLIEHSYVKNPYVLYIKSLLLGKPMQVVWAGDYADNEEGSEHNLYELSTRSKASKTSLESVPDAIPRMKYLVNHTKKVYIPYSAIKKDRFGRRLDPLPLFTADGNGRGGGDYRGENLERVGEWARDIISVEENRPKGYEKIMSPFCYEY